MTPSSPALKDFFISYNRHDKQWAEWVAWTLEEAGYTVIIQAWDFRPGGNFALDMNRAVDETKSTIAVLSETFLKSDYTQPEWAAAFARDPRSAQRKLIPMRVGECQPTGLLAQIVYVDLVGTSEEAARELVLGALKERAKPATKPTFPGATQTTPERVAPERVEFPSHTESSTNPAASPPSSAPSSSPERASAYPFNRGGDNNWAIVVGINEYEHLPPEDHLKFAVRDAVKVREFLCQQAQFPADNVLLCSDIALGSPSLRRPSRSGLRDLLLNQIKRAQGADNFWFFYAGHGVVHGHQDFLLPCDGNPDDLRETAIPISFVTDCLRDCGVHNVVLVLDMCRNRTRGNYEGSRDIGQVMGEQTLEIARAQGIVTLFSCSRGQRSYEIKELQQGAFTHTLLTALQQSTTPRALEQYLTTQLPALNRQYGKPIQVPMVIPEPGWKYDLPLLLGCATAADIHQLAVQARDVELEGDDARAEGLWWQVIEAAHSTPSDRTTARKALERINRRRASSQAPSLAVPERDIVVPTPDIEGVIVVPSPPAKPSLPTFQFEVVTVHERGQEVERRPGEAQYFTQDLGNGVVLDMVLIPAGNFMMGSPADEPERREAEGPPHEVNVPTFFMGRYPVTQAQWCYVAGLPPVNRQLDPDPARFKGDNRPVEQVSWYEAFEFCDRLSRYTGKEYRLPTEAEWEYACRSGTTTSFYIGKTLTTDVANYNGNYTYNNGFAGEYRKETTPVDHFGIATAFGLYGMHGNVWEWCADHWHENYEGVPIDGSAWLTDNESSDRVVRGGSWFNSPGLCRSAYRDPYPPDYRRHTFGFRVVCSAPRTLQ